MIYIPDNYDAFISRENEQERMERLRERFEIELEEIENEQYTGSCKTGDR